MKLVICPACGGIVEAERDEDLVRLAREHTLDAHDYDIPAEHVLKAAFDESGPWPTPFSEGSNHEK